MNHVYEKRIMQDERLPIAWVDEICKYCGRNKMDAPEDETCAKRVDAILKYRW